MPLMWTFILSHQYKDSVTIKKNVIGIYLLMWKDLQDRNEENDPHDWVWQSRHKRLCTVSTHLVRRNTHIHRQAWNDIKNANNGLHWAEETDGFCFLFSCKFIFLYFV